jgi:hypothetical protein
MDKWFHLPTDKRTKVSRKLGHLSKELQGKAMKLLGSLLNGKNLHTLVDEILEIDEADLTMHIEVTYGVFEAQAQAQAQTQAQAEAQAQAQVLIESRGSNNLETVNSENIKSNIDKCSSFSWTRASFKFVKGIPTYLERVNFNMGVPVSNNVDNAFLHGASRYMQSSLLALVKFLNGQPIDDPGSEMGIDGKDGPSKFLRKQINAINASKIDEQEKKVATLFGRLSVERDRRLCGINIICDPKNSRSWQVKEARGSIINRTLTYVLAEYYDTWVAMVGCKNKYANSRIKDMTLSEYVAHHKGNYQTAFFGLEVQDAGVRSKIDFLLGVLNKKKIHTLFTASRLCSQEHNEAYARV